MSDLVFTPANVRLLSGDPATGTAGESIEAGDLIHFDVFTESWLLGNHEMPKGRYGIALGDGALGQTIAIASQPGSIIDLGDFILDEGDFVVASAANAGKLTLYENVDIPAGDTLFIVGVANQRRQLMLKMSHTGITAMALITGQSEVSLLPISLVATGTVT